MKVVLASLPAFGHVYPLVPLALALERTGAEVVFATGEEFASRLPARTVRGAEGTWQGALFKKLVRPRLAPPAELEYRRPPRFAQGVGEAEAVEGRMSGALQRQRRLEDLALERQQGSGLPAGHRL